MKKLILLVSGLLLVTDVFSGTIKDRDQTRSSNIAFTENKGQIYDQNYNPRPDILYGVMTGDLAVHIRKSGISYQLNKVDEYKENKDPKTGQSHKEILRQSIYRIDLNWLNANSEITRSEGEALQGFNNYYLQSCPEGAINVKRYNSITLYNIYNGINLHYYQKHGTLKHDYIVTANADYKQIQIQISGAEIYLNTDGSLLLSTPFGKVHEGAPVVYQNGHQLNAKWLVKNNVLSFELEKYDPNIELVIDPATRIWGTYYGTNSYDNAHSCSTDASGNVYLTGYTDANFTSTIIATQGSHQSSFGGQNDAFLVKFDKDGVRLWGTYYGGSGNEQGQSCVTDALGNVFITGQTSSGTGNIIATNGSHQSSFGGGFDAYLVKFNSSGVRQWGTYYGGGGYDFGRSCCTDISGNVYLAGNGTSTANIATPGSHQPSLLGNLDDAFLVKFNTNGVRQWGTYYGGSQAEIGYSCSTDAIGNVYLAGYGSSNTGTEIATQGCHQPTLGGINDAFLVKFNANGVRQWGTYYGGTGNDFGFSCIPDGSGNIYLAGQTGSGTNTIIATTGSHQNTFGGGNSDAFLVKFNSSGVRQWSTYYGGGTGFDAINSCAVDMSGNIYVTGMTESSAGIATIGSHQAVFGGGLYDGFLAKFSPAGIRQWGTYYGDTPEDYSEACAVDVSGFVYMAGYTATNTGTIIATPGSHQSTFGGAQDAFLIKFDGCDVAPSLPSITGPTLVCAGVVASYLTPLNTGANSFSWSVPIGWSFPGIVNVFTVIPASNGIISLVTINACGSSPQQTLNVTVNPAPVVTVNDGSICAGQSFTLTAGGASSYTYSSGNVVSPMVTTSYSVTGTSTTGCVSSNIAVATITVNALPSIIVYTNDNILCIGESTTLTAGGASAFTFNPGGAGNTITISPITTSNYTVTGIDLNGCENSAVLTQSVDACTALLGYSTVPETKIFPNPTTDVFTIAIDSDVEVTILNIVGQKVYTNNLSAGHHRINVENFSKGIYIVEVDSSKSSKFIQMVIE